ncbi:DUF6216 family protein [Xanthomonas campestris pv. campestris]|nr:DUF6216 family protein [Xanthomonas campestris pv. campestris]MEB1554798.1 DUF6216 family protein [Xanthomonas campestris pv. campestris]
METGASWTEIVTTASAAAPIVGLSAVALYLCYKSGTLHPLRNRLVRLFISREDIEQGPILDSLSERSAVVSFGMIYGIHLDTVTEVETLITRSRAQNFPLHLIGAAGSSFDRETFTVKPEKSPRKRGDVLIAMMLVASYLAVIFFLAGTFKNEILIRVKATNTLLWVDPKKNESTARGAFTERNVTFSQKHCRTSEGSRTIGPDIINQPSYNLSVFCAIWASPIEQRELISALPKQRIAFGAAAMLCLMAMVGSWQALIRRKAVRKLEQRAHRLI